MKIVLFISIMLNALLLYLVAGSYQKIESTSRENIILGQKNGEYLEKLERSEKATTLAQAKNKRYEQFEDGATIKCGWMEGSYMGEKNGIVKIQTLGSRFERYVQEFDREECTKI